MSLGKCSWECLPSFQRDVTVYGNEVIEEAALILMIAIILKKKNHCHWYSHIMDYYPQRWIYANAFYCTVEGFAPAQGGSDWHKQILGIGMPNKYSTFPTITFWSLSCHFIVDSCVSNNKSKYEHCSNYDPSVWASWAQQGLISKLVVTTITSLDGNFHVFYCTMEWVHETCLFEREEVLFFKLFKLFRQS